MQPLSPWPDPDCHSSRVHGLHGASQPPSEPDMHTGGRRAARGLGWLRRGPQGKKYIGMAGVEEMGSPGALPGPARRWVEVLICPPPQTDSLGPQHHVTSATWRSARRGVASNKSALNRRRTVSILLLRQTCSQVCSLSSKLSWLLLSLAREPLRNMASMARAARLRRKRRLGCGFRSRRVGRG